MKNTMLMAAQVFTLLFFLCGIAAWVIILYLIVG
jgi:hypothetical protein